MIPESTVIASHHDEVQGLHYIKIDWTPLILAMRATALAYVGCNPTPATVLEQTAYYLAHPDEATKKIKDEGRWGA